MKVSKGQSQPEIVAAAFLILYMVLGSPFLYQVLTVTQLMLFLIKNAEFEPNSNRFNLNSSSVDMSFEFVFLVMSSRYLARRGLWLIRKVQYPFRASHDRCAARHLS